MGRSNVGAFGTFDERRNTPPRWREDVAGAKHGRAFSSRSRGGGDRSITPSGEYRSPASAEAADARLWCGSLSTATGVTMWNTLKEVREIAGQLVSFVEIAGKLKEVVWAALPGSQASFLACPEFEVLFEGTRGGCGKTVALLMDFCQFVGLGMGAAHRGILLRRTFPELEFVEATARLWIPKIFPGASFNAQQHVWTFPDGATLRFGYLEFTEQFEPLYQGKEFTWVGLEELANWPDCECLKLMSSCLRSTHPLAKLHLRATCNTYGIGADAIKERYRLPLIPFNRTLIRAGH